MDLLSRSASLAPSFSSIKPSICTSNSSSISLKPISWNPKTSIESRNLVSRSPRLAKAVADDYAHRIMASQRQQMRAAQADPMGLLLNERILFLAGEINDFVADAIISQLLMLDANNPKKDIRLFINSYGGSLSACLAIFDVVQLLRADVTTVVLGIAASSAALILGGGTKGKRFAMPNSRIMVQQPRGGAGGDSVNVTIMAKELLNNKESVKRIISKVTGRSLTQTGKDIEDDKYMSPIEAVDYGIIDGVIDRDCIVPLNPLPDPTSITPTRDAEFNVLDTDFFFPEIPDDEIY